MSLQLMVAYYRVSSKQQKRSGLGLLAQGDIVSRFVQTNGGELIGEFTEVESGRNSGRPQLQEALRTCRIYGAKLVVSRLDRLARSVAMISKLLTSGVDFVAADMPLANRFTIHIIAAVAEYEARLIAERTKSAIAAAKARGKKFGFPDPNRNRITPYTRRALAYSIRTKAKARALDFLPLLCELRDRGETVHGIALQLTAMGIETPRNGKAWRDKVIRHMFEYAGERKPKPRASRITVAQRAARNVDLPVL